MSLLIAEGLDQMTFKGPFQPKPFNDSKCSFYRRSEQGERAVGITLCWKRKLGGSIYKIIDKQNCPAN